MAEFTVNAQRVDPYKNFKFRLKWDGQYVAGVSKISALRRTTQVAEHREGGGASVSHRSPGETSYAPIVLERGRTHDPEFEKWANKTWNLGGGPGTEVSLADFRKDIYIELHNEAGQLVMAFKVFRCWPSEYVALSDLNANGEASVAIESLTLQNEGWERDTSVTEPTEPSFSGA
jgi:phage tail-like protein